MHYLKREIDRRRSALQQELSASAANALDVAIRNHTDAWVAMYQSALPEVAASHIGWTTESIHEKLSNLCDMVFGKLENV